MPTLRWSEKNERHYIRTSIRNNFITWQLSSDGVAYLRQRGIRVEQDFPVWMLRELLFLGFAFTFGTGIYSRENGENVQQFLRSNPYAWQFKLISPPTEDYTSLEDLETPFYLAGHKKLPVFQCGHEMLIGIVPTVSSHGAFARGQIFILHNNVSETIVTLPISPTSGEMKSTTARSSQSRYLAFNLKEPGNYLLSEREGQIKPLAFVAVLVSNRARTAELPPLSVCLQRSGQPVRLSSFEISNDETQPYEICYTDNSDREISLLNIECPVPLDMRWSDGLVSSMKREMFPQQALSSVSEPLTRALQKKRPFMLHLDAGMFGQINLRFVPLIITKTQNSQQIRLSPELVNRLRWIDMAVRTGKRSGLRMVVLPEKLRVTFVRARHQPECTRLASVTSLPLELLPHVRAVARAVKEELSI